MSVSSEPSGDMAKGGGKRLEAAQVSLNDCLACRYAPLDVGLPYARLM